MRVSVGRENIFQAVIVVIEDGDTPAHRLGEIFPAGKPVVGYDKRSEQNRPSSETTSIAV